MIGLVVVSHSRKIAEGVVELIYEMVDKDFKIIPAGGTSDGRIGTDPIMIKEAIEKAYDGDGIGIIVDIGSSLMNAELAMELLEEEIRKKVIILDTPIVEGSISVAVQAYISNNMEEVLKAAEEARTTKKLQEQF
ncbi:dihydroxyacetone kinase phosphoryl donor subunit DhaM [Tepidimicrobium xylanilyticum]|uniref:dihydroxyacetone kinase phosphoryl donor subunit DhaM n=1 Tax=Tepidimicrobium xylanilyticum TaxID=1123352 RepID=UPI002656C710|nr:dihydroxyacetone kinase phosphoryl donor subunit DhaM [Tepidimicrobium xylanilyticum]GMG96951.1 PTS-dependent dihydroxyacetone kinase phosphotransferase subunit DhaM [Tepidimicrobium xylanilyticum]